MHMLWISSLTEVKVLDSRNLLAWYWWKHPTFFRIHPDYRQTWL